MIKGIIFDMDGLMFDTETMYIDAVPKLAAKAGIDLPKEEMQRIIGCDHTMLDAIEKDYPGLREVIAKNYQARRMEHFYHYFPKPGSANKNGLKELVRWLNENRIPYAIASSSLKDHILEMTHYAQADIQPSAVISSLDGYPSKPDPAVFLAAAKAMGLKPEECLVLEDSKFGIQAAKTGGFPSIWIPDRLKADDEMRKSIQLELPSLHAVKEYLEGIMDKSGHSEQNKSRIRRSEGVHHEAYRQNQSNGI